MGKLRFGPAGIPIQCNANSTLEGVKCCSKLGLDAMEMEFVQGVRLKEHTANEIKAIANKLDIMLSSHAPYFINFCSDDKKKIETSSRNLIQSAKITAAAGGRITVFHPGFYQKQSPEKAYEIAKTNLKSLVQKLDADIVLGAETVGKRTAFGGLDEVIKLSQDIPEIQPVLDFAHIHARGDQKLKTQEDYQKVFNKLEKELGDYVNSFHAHFSEINYTEKGERNHLSLGTNNEPPYKELLKTISENGYSGVIICETPELDIDAQKMQEFYNSLGG